MLIVQAVKDGDDPKEEMIRLVIAQERGANLPVSEQQATSVATSLTISETSGTAVMTAYLTSAGIPASHAATYASKLDEEGYDTVAIFNTLSVDDLTRDFAFKRGHAAAVENFRTSKQP